ncbi:GEVED domain-containing protein [Brumimicrobium aurantiacum]|uniref:T9SS C-terminal target domain-containing protein n=1 Tax=Brumimicrobium aurantiacum TaxID=1737063 RepID=A0A3E1EWZ5_9FLAO|nr:GEVED domain-containing protein [Brumimicrobium aurantiacum]RFC54076.1 T9SS C-terminal target domain-containing protein [Brumimicrobium aurantiacum]
MKRKFFKGLLLMGAFALSSNLNAQSYCDFTITSSNPQHINSFATTGAVSDINNTGSGAGSTTAGYSDFTSTVLQSYEMQTVDFTIEANNTSTYGVSIFIDWNNDFTFDSAEKVYGSSGYVSFPLSNSFTVPAGTALGQYRMRVVADYLGGNPDACSGSSAEAEDYTIEIVNIPSCLPPQNIYTSNLTSTSAEIGWTEVNTATTWNVEYGAAGFTPGNGTLVNGVTSNPYTFTISPLSEYDFYVQSDCGGGDLSAWSGPYSFSNQYCDFTITSGSPQHINSFTTTGGVQDISNLNSGAGTTAAGYSDFTSIVLQAYETQIIDFTIEASNTSTYGTSIYVDYDNDFNFSSAEKVYTSSGYTSMPTSGSFMIPFGTTTGQYRMRVVSDYFGSNPGACSGSSAEAEDYTLDIVTSPSCLPPIEIDTVSVGTNSVELEWNELNGATNWVIEYGLSGFVPGNGTEVVASTNPFTVTGLNPSIEYEFYVRTDCGAGDSSDWRGPISQYTDCGIAVAPFYEGFNNAVQPQCWENLSSDPSSSSNNSWNFNDQGDYGAANNGRLAGEFTKVDGNSPYADSVMLITPQIDISQLANPYLSFEWFSNNIENPGDNVPLIIEVFDGTNWNHIDTLKGDDPEWRFVNYDLNAFANNIIQVRFMVNKSVTINYSWYNDILLDNVRVDDCIDLGGVDGVFDVCRFDNTVNLNDNIIVKPTGSGNWSFPDHPEYLNQDSVLSVSSLSEGGYDLYYVERNVCYDTTFATINIYNESRAGQGGVIEVCQNEPINLYGVLSGNVDLGGEWYDYQGTLVGSQAIAANIPGSYNYEYIADNGVCPADTAVVEVSVRPDCDFLSIEGEMFADVSVYPNPASSVLNIVNPSNTSELKIEMLDMNGRVVMVEDKALNNASEATLTINHLENGVYTLRVYNNEGYKTFKVVKQ